MNGYMTTKEAAEKWGITQRQVQNHCKMNRIPGVVTHGTTYMIPENATRPVYGFFSEQLIVARRESYGGAYKRRGSCG